MRQEKVGVAKVAQIWAQSNKKYEIHAQIEANKADFEEKLQSEEEKMRQEEISVAML